MKLQFLGHACFLLDDGVHKVLTDPFLSGAGRPEWAEKVDPDVIFVTHGHGDHVGDAAAIARRTGAPVCCTAELADAVAGVNKNLQEITYSSENMSAETKGVLQSIGRLQENMQQFRV